MTTDDILRIAITRPRVFEVHLVRLFGVGHLEARAALRELKDAGHLVGSRRKGYSFGYLHAVLDRIEQGGTVTAADLAAHFGILPDCLEQALAELSDAGRITNGPGGHRISTEL
jgi:hypothetical protein